MIDWRTGPLEITIDPDGHMNWPNEVIARRFMNALETGICPMCNLEIKFQSDDTGSIYTKPCNHRLFHAQPAKTAAMSDVSPPRSEDGPRSAC